MLISLPFALNASRHACVSGHPTCFLHHHTMRIIAHGTLIVQRLIRLISTEEMRLLPPTLRRKSAKSCAPPAEEQHTGRDQHNKLVQTNKLANDSGKEQHRNRSRVVDHGLKCKNASTHSFRAAFLQNYLRWYRNASYRCSYEKGEADSSTCHQRVLQTVRGIEA